MECHLFGSSESSPPFLETSLERRRQWHPTPVLLPGKSHGQRSLVGCSPWGHEESDTTERLHFHFSLLCIGEGNGNPLQCSCLENPRDREALVGCCLWGRTELDKTEATQQQQQQCGQRSRNGMTNADDNSVLTISKIQHIILTFKVAVITCLVAKSCPTLCDPMDCSPPGSSVHGIIQARILECIAISFSRGSSPPRG